MQNNMNTNMHLLSQALVTVNARSFGAIPQEYNNGAGANAGLQAAIDYIACRGGGEVIVDDDYWVKGHVSNATGNHHYLDDEGGIALKNGVHLRFTSRGVLRIIPNSEARYVCVRIYNKSNVRISGPGRIIGDREAHIETAGEWGYGIAVTAGSNITIQDVTITDCWGDGINIQRMGMIVSRDVRLSDVVCHNNRRQGLSIEGVRGFIAIGCRFSGTNGTAPECGVDVEPSTEAVEVSDVTFDACRFEDNKAAGLLIHTDTAEKIAIRDCKFLRNLSIEGQLVSYCTVNTVGVRVSGCLFTHDAGKPSGSIKLQGGFGYVVENNEFDGGIAIATGPSAAAVGSVRIVGNRITNYPGRDIVWQMALTKVVDVTIDGNLLDAGTNSSTDTYGLNVMDCSRVLIVNNRIRGFARGIALATCADVAVDNNAIDNAGFWALQCSSKWVRFRRNIIAGACHKNSGGPIILATEGCVGLQVTENDFVLEPRLPGASAGRAGRILDWVPAVTDTYASRNRRPSVVPLASANLAQLTTGFVGDESGVMSTITAWRPIDPPPGSQVFDTTLHKQVTWDGTTWRDATGATH